MSIKSEFWKPHVSAWRGSGLSQAVYCRRYGLDVKRLAYWQRVLDRSKAPPSSGLLPIQVREASLSSGQIVLRLPNGLQLCVPPEVEPARIVPLVRALQTC